MKIALIGYGYWGPNLAKNIHSIPTMDLVGICECNKERLAKAKKIYGNSLFYTDDYHVFLEDAAIDAVAIATPTKVSYKIAMNLLEAGKHIFIEKPIASNAREAEDIKMQSEKYKLIVHCDHIMLYHPVIRYIKAMMDADELGDLLYIDISRVNLGPLRQDVNALLDLAVHDIAVINFLSNGEEFDKVSALGQTCYGKQETLTYLTIKYKSFIAHIKSSWISPVKERKTVIAGTKKMVIFDDMLSDKLAIYDRGFDIQMAEEYGEYEYHIRTGDLYYPHIQQEDALKNSLLHFEKCVKENRESLSGPNSSLKVMRVLDEAMRQLGNY